MNDMKSKAASASFAVKGTPPGGDVMLGVDMMK
jgi:hypothetical protein